MLAWYLSKPVRHLRAAFDAVGAGRLDTRIGALIQAHADLLHRVLENVIRNAVKFTDEGTAVEIAIVRTSDPARLVVRVSDRRPGVPEDQLQAIFELFSAARAEVGPPDSAWAWRSPEGPSKPTADTSVPWTGPAVACRSRLSFPLKRVLAGPSESGRSRGWVRSVRWHSGTVPARRPVGNVRPQCLAVRLADRLRLDPSRALPD